MKEKILLTFIMMVLGINFLNVEGRAQEDSKLIGPGYYEVHIANDSLTIPFEFFGSDILIKPKINGVQTRMLVDNGVLWDQLFFFGSAVLDSIEFNYTGEINVGGQGNGEPILNNYAEGNQVDFGNICFYNQDAIISPPELGLQELWKGVDGQVSAMLFKHFIIEIDFEEMIMILHAPDSFKAEMEYQKIPLMATGQNEYSIPFSFSIPNGELIETIAQLDLGGSFDYLVSYPDDLDISFPPEIEEKVLGYGVQGELIGHRFNGGAINVAGFMLEGLSGEFVRQKSGNSNFEVIIGFNILSRFNNILDYHNSFLFLKPKIK